jgi:protein-tyrosine phosphatase
MNRFTKLFRMISDDDSSFTWTYNNMDLIVEAQGKMGALYLGNWAAAQDQLLLAQHRITSVLTVAAQIQIKYDTDIVPHHMEVPALDIPDFKLEKFFEDCFDWIHQQRLVGRNVLVHCAAGVSRSSTIVIGYLMRTEKWDLSKTIKLVKGKRPCVSPNSGFFSQLENYERKLFGKTSAPSKPDSRSRSLPPVKNPLGSLNNKLNQQLIKKPDMAVVGKSENIYNKPLITTIKGNEYPIQTFSHAKFLKTGPTMKRFKF